MLARQNHHKSQFVAFQFILISDKGQTCQAEQAKKAVPVSVTILGGACQPVWFREDFMCGTAVCCVCPCW